MAHPSFAPAARVDDDASTRPTVRPRSRAHLSVVPPVSATPVTLAKLEPLGEAFRKLGTLPPAPCDNDELTEDEIFAIWVASLA
jgi:hypothetical protein